ncbi:MAG: hypothetical protein HY420_00800 [Candidatus Kerfeldbacteria bacterium]|nr:hypothetical protein [Candidatus Kerfeldbacteria bacterium]
MRVVILSGSEALQAFGWEPALDEDEVIIERCGHSGTVSAWCSDVMTDFDPLDLVAPVALAVQEGEECRIVSSELLGSFQIHGSDEEFDDDGQPTGEGPRAASLPRAYCAQCRTEECPLGCSGTLDKAGSCSECGYQAVGGRAGLFFLKAELASRRGVSGPINGYFPVDRSVD